MKWDWEGAKDGLRDEGLPMAGMVLGALAGSRSKVPNSTVLGSGMGYAAGALANVLSDEYLTARRKRKAVEGVAPPSGQSKLAGGESVLGTYLPGAVGGTIGATLAGGLTPRDSDKKGRNLLAGAALGYGAGELGAWLHAARKLKK